MEGNGISWALWSWRCWKFMGRGEGSGPQWSLQCASPGPGALDALAPWGRCCILTLQMRKPAQKNKGSHPGSHSRPVEVGLGFRPRSVTWKPTICLELAFGNWEVMEEAGP